MNNLICQLCDLIVLAMAHSLSKPTILPQKGQRSSVEEQETHKLSVGGSSPPAATKQMSEREKKLRDFYAPKIAKWKKRSAEGYLKNLDKKWERWFEEMSK